MDKKRIRIIAVVLDFSHLLCALSTKQLPPKPWYTVNGSIVDETNKTFA